jgi:hypothetical protein
MMRRNKTIVRQNRMPSVSHRLSLCTSLTSVALWSSELVS